MESNFIEKRYLDEEWARFSTTDRKVSIYYELIENKWLFASAFKEVTINKEESSHPIKTEFFFARTKYSGTKGFSKKEDIENTSRKLDTLMESYNSSDVLWKHYNYVPLDSIFIIAR